MKLSGVIFKSIFFISFISACLAFFITVMFQYDNYKNDRLNLKQEFNKIQTNKNRLSTGEYVKLQEKLIENEINRKELSLKDVIFNQISSLLLLIFLATVLFYFISKRIATLLDNNITLLIDSFKEASTIHEEINEDNFLCEEFSILAQKLNKILRDRNRTYTKLEDYKEIVDDNIAIGSADINGNITAVSDAFCKHSGYEQNELLGKPYSLLRKKRIPPKYHQKMWQNLQNGIKWSGEIKAKKKCGEIYWAQTIIHPEYKNDEITGFTTIKQDITKMKNLERLSITDDLTGLYNKRYFNKRIDEEVGRAKRNNKYLSFTLIDIDYFKKYNDTYGHQAGDEALKKVASVFKKHTNRSGDFAFRVGGEEFSLIFSSDSIEKSLEFASLIRKNIEELKIEHKASDVNEFLTISVGLVVKKGLNISNSDDIYKEADDALYKAKEMGRNKVYLSVG